MEDQFKGRFSLKKFKEPGSYYGWEIECVINKNETDEEGHKRIVEENNRMIKDFPAKE